MRRRYVTVTSLVPPPGELRWYRAQGPPFCATAGAGKGSGVTVVGSFGWRVVSFYELGILSRGRVVDVGGSRGFERASYQSTRSMTFSGSMIPYM